MGGRHPLSLDFHMYCPTDRRNDFLSSGSGADRLAQEMILGVGGVRLMNAIKKIDYFHFNEGHAVGFAAVVIIMIFFPLQVFAGFELLRQAMAKPESLPYDVALMEVKSTCRFTTHTPVAAGNETHEVVGLRQVVF